MSLEENKILVRRFVEAVNQRDFRVVDEVLHPDYVLTSRNETLHGAEEYKKAVQELASRVSAFHFTVQDMVAEGDRVAYTWLYQEIKGGQETSRVGITLLRIAEGKIIEDRYW